MLLVDNIMDWEEASDVINAKMGSQEVYYKVTGGDPVDNGHPTVSLYHRF